MFQTPERFVRAYKLHHTQVSVGKYEVGEEGCLGILRRNDKGIIYVGPRLLRSGVT